MAPASCSGRSRSTVRCAWLRAASACRTRASVPSPACRTSDLAPAHPVAHRHRHGRDLVAGAGPDHRLVHAAHRAVVLAPDLQRRRDHRGHRHGHARSARICSTVGCSGCRARLDHAEITSTTTTEVSLRPGSRPAGLRTSILRHRRLFLPSVGSAAPPAGSRRPRPAPAAPARSVVEQGLRLVDPACSSSSRALRCPAAWPAPSGTAAPPAPARAAPAPTVARRASIWARAASNSPSAASSSSSRPCRTWSRCSSACRSSARACCTWPRVRKPSKTGTTPGTPTLQSRRQSVSNGAHDRGTPGSEVRVGPPMAAAPPARSAPRPPAPPPQRPAPAGPAAGPAPPQRGPVHVRQPGSSGVTSASGCSAGRLISRFRFSSASRRAFCASTMLRLQVVPLHPGPQHVELRRRALLAEQLHLLSCASASCVRLPGDGHELVRQHRLEVRVPHLQRHLRFRLQRPPGPPPPHLPRDLQPRADRPAANTAAA
jgi:hypothetical protein